MTLVLISFFSFIFLNLSLTVNLLLLYCQLSWSWHTLSQKRIGQSIDCSQVIFLNVANKHIQCIGFHLVIVSWYDLMFIFIGFCNLIQAKIFPFFDCETVSIIDEKFLKLPSWFLKSLNRLVLGRQKCCGRKSVISPFVDEFWKLTVNILEVLKAVNAVQWIRNLRCDVSWVNRTQKVEVFSYAGNGCESKNSSILIAIYFWKVIVNSRLEGCESSLPEISLSVICPRRFIM